MSTSSTVTQFFQSYIVTKSHYKVISDFLYILQNQISKDS